MAPCPLMDSGLDWSAFGKDPLSLQMPLTPTPLEAAVCRRQVWDRTKDLYFSVLKMYLLLLC